MTGRIDVILRVEKKQRTKNEIQKGHEEELGKKGKHNQFNVGTTEAAGKK